MLKDVTEDLVDEKREREDAKSERIQLLDSIQKANKS